MPFIGFSPSEGIWVLYYLHLIVTIWSNALVGNAEQTTLRQLK